MNWRSLGLVLGLALAMLLSRPLPGSAKVAHDAQCDPGDAAPGVVGRDGDRSHGVRPSAALPPGSFFGYLAYSESFAAGHKGKLTIAFVDTFNLDTTSAATYTVELWEADLFGLPTGSAPLATTTVEHPAGVDFDVEEATFASPAKVTKGKEYALVLSVSDTANGVTIGPNNPCAGTFGLSADGSLGAFEKDPDNHDMAFSIDIKVKRRHHKH
ncbi:MAG TPA: hypothetical protein VFI22_03800 [Thermomicrobiales bacterium]|nr:hypothetical protein [Thermomicrobiales bacterium]